MSVVRRCAVPVIGICARSWVARRMRTFRFGDLRALMPHLGFDERTRGSHHALRKQGLPERVNLQRENGNAKPYQVRQVRRLALKHHLGGDE